MSAPPLELTDEFVRALSLLNAGRSLFLTGKAGSGKSTLIRHFMASTDRHVLVAAPTGIAALNVDGYTIHRLFGFYPGISIDEIQNGRYYPARFASALKALDTLIIDEASMIRADLFDMLVAALERFGPQPGAPFGGVQIALVGDLFQLPPVVQEAEADYFVTRYQTPYFFSADRFSSDNFPTVALTKVFRQIGDPAMTAILNAIREGALLAQAREQLNARTDADFEPPQGEFWLTLAPTNRIVTARNRRHLDRLDSSEHIHHARLTGDLKLFDPPVEKELRFKVGAQIMMLTNETGDRWVNGTIGRILAVSGAGPDIVVTVEFRDGSVADVAPHTWDATRPVMEGGRLRSEVIGTYTQLPFKLAWAITIHKSQGQTVDRLVVDLTGGAFAFGQVYVALSRCTSMDGLVLTRPVLAKDLKTDRRVVRFLHAAVPGEHERRLCAIGMCLVGDEGRMSRPRPVEIAVAFDDGTAISTLVNPQRDLADARRAYGITVDDVLLAPTLTEAWSVLAPVIEGCTPVGVATDEAIGLIDFELKRLGTVTALPLGIDAPAESLNSDERAGLHAAAALDRARTAMEAHRRLSASNSGPNSASTAFQTFESDHAEVGYLLTRDPDAPSPRASRMPTLTALLDVSRAISAILRGREVPADLRNIIEASTTDANLLPAQHVAITQLRMAAGRVRLTPELSRKLREVGTLLGVEILDNETSMGNTPTIDHALVPGSRICFTGTAETSEGRIMGRDEMHELAVAGGLTPVNTVSKTRCDILVVAEVGTQSGKARKAHEFGKPIFSADEFFTWLAGN